MAANDNHPFLEGLKEVPAGKKKDLQKIKTWLTTQNHIPEISDEYVYLFLHACYYSHEKTKSAIENYFSIRYNHPAVFNDRDYHSARVKAVFDLGYLIKLPVTTPEGYRVLLYSVKDNDPTKMNFSDAVKTFCMFNDVVLSEDGLQQGYVVIFDMKGVQIGHLARVSLPALRCFMMYIQEAHPCRLKEIHVLNTCSWIHHVMRIVVPLVKSELLSLVRFHKTNAPENFPLGLLPKEYGGDQAPVEELFKDTTSMMEKYRPWLIETNGFVSDESKRPKKASWWGLFTGSNKTNTDELDERAIVKNLQID